MSFTDEQPFLEAIKTRYHDDGLRFIYADFLDDIGDPERAELVRVQIALARMDEDHPRRAELANREAELLADNGGRWSGHLRDLISDCECEFRRGVLDSVVVDATRFLAVGEELVRRVPIVRLRLSHSAAVLPDIVVSPLLANVRELDLFGDNLSNDDLCLLTKSPFFKDLETLNLGFNKIDDVGVHNLARASNLPKLTSLSLSDNGRITSAGLIKLAESPFLGGLTALDVSSNDIDDAGLRSIISSKTLTRLHTLRLSENHIGDAGATALAQSALLGRIIARSFRLELVKNEIGPSGVAALAAAPVLSRCLSFDLTHNFIGDEGLASIIGSPHLCNLRVLKLGWNSITDAGITALRHSWDRVFGHLRIFNLPNNGLYQSGIQILESAKRKWNVSLDVSGNHNTSAGNGSPISVAELVPNVLQNVSDLAETAELRRRVSHPTMRAGDHTNRNS
jgi:uncharacterized protein (TIGR02996 family)